MDKYDQALWKLYDHPRIAESQPYDRGMGTKGRQERLRGGTSYGIGRGLHSEPDLPPDRHLRGWYETGAIRPEGFQHSHAHIGDPFHELLMLRLTARGVFPEILFDTAQKVLHLAWRHVDGRRNKVIASVCYQELD